MERLGMEKLQVPGSRRKSGFDVLDDLGHRLIYRGPMFTAIRNIHSCRLLARGYFISPTFITANTAFMI